ncbi:MAG: hypothetical protein IT473_01645 [Lysobacter sp.]|nr:hypothetical protein [Lysobacter sp.]
MKSRFWALSLTTVAALPFAASAAEIASAPSAEAARYSWVVVDSRKLKVPLGVALAQLPGEECVGFSDLAQVSCSRFQLKYVYGYNSVGAMGMPVPMTIDDRGRAREAKVDGLKVKRWINWNAATQGRTIEIAFAQPTTEFGFDFLPTLDGQPNFPITYGFRITVNGQDMGYVSVAPQVGYLGIRASEGETLQTLVIEAVGETGGLPQGPFYGGMFYVR